MGRKSKIPGAIPRFRPRKRGRTTYYYYDHGGKPRKETPLGCDYGLAIKRWAELERESNLPPPAIVTFRHVAEHYQRDVIPTKATRTQKDNGKELAKLLEYFDDPPCPFESIEAGDVADYLRWRSAAPVRAAREKALLSHLWNWARENRYTNQPNPCAGVKAKGSKGRDAYIDDATFGRVWEKAPDVLRDAMDLAYLTGQRPADVLSLTEMDVRDGAVHVRQGKTATKVRIEVAGALDGVLKRIRHRKAGHTIHCTRLVVNASGKPIGVNALSRYWKRACEAAKVEGYQFRDLRAKAATDTEEATGSIRQSQRQLGHASVRMTEHYARNRLGAKVMPTRELRNKAEIAEKDSGPKPA